MAESDNYDDKQISRGEFSLRYSGCSDGRQTADAFSTLTPTMEAALPCPGHTRILRLPSGRCARGIPVSLPAMQRQRQSVKCFS